MARDRITFRCSEQFFDECEVFARSDDRTINDWARAICEIVHTSGLTVSEVRAAVEFAKDAKAKHATPFPEVLKKNAKQ